MAPDVRAKAVAVCPGSRQEHLINTSIGGRGEGTAVHAPGPQLLDRRVVGWGWRGEDGGCCIKVGGNANSQATRKSAYVPIKTRNATERRFAVLKMCKRRLRMWLDDQAFCDGT